LAIAAAFGLSSAALCQTSSQILGTPKQQPQQTPATPGMDTDPHVTEMKVELAWLANPATFPCHLEAVRVGSALEINGYVPNEVYREKALKVARDESGMRVIDKLQIQVKVDVQFVHKPPQALHKSAVEALGKALSHRAKGLIVSVWTDGQVMVKGTVASY